MKTTSWSNACLSLDNYPTLPIMNRKLLFFPFALVLSTALWAKDLPKALLIGDSISIGYTPHVVAALKGKVQVIHHRGNAQHTGTGLKMLDRWVGNTQWDVIHFNWGLWDLCYRHPQSKEQGRRDKKRGTLTTSSSNTKTIWMNWSPV